MRQKTERHQGAAARLIKDIRRQTRKRYSPEEKIRIVLAGLRGEDTIAELCRQEGISQGVYYSWSKEFLEAGKKRLAGDVNAGLKFHHAPEQKYTTRILRRVVPRPRSAACPQEADAAVPGLWASRIRSQSFIAI